MSENRTGRFFDSHCSCYIIINVLKSLLCDEQCESMSYRPRTTLTGNIDAVDSYTLEKTANDLLSEIKFLADRTNGRAYATVLRLSSSVCNVMYCG